MRSPSLWITALGALSGCGDATPEAVGSFVAMQQDFQGYARWPARDLGTTTLAGHPSGARRVFIRGSLAPGALSWPVGTMLVKEIRVSQNPREWELFAMVKRGGGYNPHGAHGWEFFLLRLNSAGIPIVVSRGSTPSDGHVNSYNGIGSGCNGCHGLPDALDYDSILTPELRPRGLTSP